MRNLSRLVGEIRDDFRRHGSSLKELQVYAMFNYRFGRYVWTLPKPFEKLGGKIYGLNMLLIEVTTGITLPREATIGKNFHLVHSGNIKVHPRSVIGDNCGLMHHVTLGQSSCRKGDQGYPKLGDNVFIGAGAKVLGGVKVGSGSQVAAHSLVVTDITPNSIVMGVPAIPMNQAMKPVFEARAAERASLAAKADNDQTKPKVA